MVNFISNSILDVNRSFQYKAKNVNRLLSMQVSKPDLRF